MENMEIVYENTSNIVRNYSSTDSERIFIKNIINKMQYFEQWENLDFFAFLKKLDGNLFREKNRNDIFFEITGYYTDEDFSHILTHLFAQRYVNAHDEDNKTEKIKEAALQDFISDKYDSGVHFFEEILQNIDDAIGRKEKNNTNTEDVVQIEWSGNTISFCYPDRGFSFYDLMAITSLGNSIKKGDINQASIGEKGIGFKSVFSVATKISIESKFFNFDIEYDENKKASVLQPSRITVPGSGKQESKLTLFFNKKFSIDGKDGFKQKLQEWLFENKKENYFCFSPFLFLKHIRNVTYTDNDFKETIEIARKNIGENDSFSVTEINKQKYLIYKESLWFSKALIEKRWGKIDAIADKEETFAIDRPIEIAFPVMESVDDNFKEKKGLFYSYLPTEMIIECPIYINVDVHLKSSRGRISESDFKDGSEWNKNIRDNLDKILEKAYLEITKRYTDGKCEESIRKVAEILWFYIKNQTTKHYFSDSLDNFYKAIIGEPVYLNASKKFVNKDAIQLLRYTNRDDWNIFADFCLHKPFPKENDKQYPADYDWYTFIKTIIPYPYNTPNWRIFCLDLYQGTKYFYECPNILENSEKNKIVIDVLSELKNYTDSKTSLSVLFVDCEGCEGDFEICSLDDKKDKVIFLKPDNDIAEDSMSLYISKKPFYYGEDKQEQSNKDYDQYKSVLKGFIAEKNWVAYINNTLSEMKKCDNYTIYDYYHKCKSFLINISLEEIKKIDCPKEIKEKFSKYVIPGKVWDNFELNGYCLYRKAIALYIEDKECPDNFGYSIFNIDETDYAEKDKLKKYVQFLIQLGVKHSPDVQLNNDKLSQAVMPSYENTRTDDDLKFVFQGDKSYKYLGAEHIIKLQQYFVQFVNFPEAKYSDEIVQCFVNKGLGLSDGFIFVPRKDISVNLTGERGGDKGYVSYNFIDKFNSASEDEVKYYIDGTTRMRLNSGKKFFADQDTYPCFSKKKYSSVEVYESNYDPQTIGQKIFDNKFIKNIMHSAPNKSFEALRWTIIWNQVFGTEYAWYDNSLSMELEEFVLHYKYLSRADIASLLPKGCSIDWKKDNKNNLATFQDIQTLIEYLQNEFALKDISEDYLKKFYRYDTTNIIEECISLKELKGNKVVKNEDPYFYIVSIDSKSKTPLTDFIGIILKLNKENIMDYQRMEIADIVGELPEEKEKKIIGLQSSISNYTDALFRDEDNQASYDDMLEFSKNCLPSVFKKTTGHATKKENWSMKEYLCEPHFVKQYAFQGYGYQCPICGSVMHHYSLSAMKYIKRIKNSDPTSKDNLPYLYFITCLNCADMIERAEKVMMKDYEENSLTDAINHFKEVCYCTDDYHLFNHSKMKTMILYLELDGHEFRELIKMSYLHMVLLCKLWKDKI